MKDPRKIASRYLITALCAGLATLFVLYVNDFWSITGKAEQYKILSNAFTVPGVILVMFTGLLWVSSDGFFDSLSYAFSRIGNMFLPVVGMSMKHETYINYKARKKEKRASKERAAHGYLSLLLVGSLFIAIAVLFIFLHYNV